jgi:hypothetical protein
MKAITNHKFVALIMLCALLVICGCKAASEDEVEYILWNSSDTGGFDDFSSPGAALGYSVNTTDSAIMIIGMKFTLPLFTRDFKPSSNAADNANYYEWGIVPAEMEDDTAKYPLVGFGTTNTAGLRTSLKNDIVGILLKGDFNDTIPERIYIATGGTITLTREEGPADFVDGTIEFTEVKKTGSNFNEAGNSEKLGYKIYFFWDTGLLSRQKNPGIFLH